MYCPEHKVFGCRFLWIWMYWRDVPRELIPLRIWLNPLNYEVTLQSGYGGRRVTMNREGQWIRNRIWRAKKAWYRLVGASHSR